MCLCIYIYTLECGVSEAKIRVHLQPRSVLSGTKRRCRCRRVRWGEDTSVLAAFPLTPLRPHSPWHPLLGRGGDLIASWQLLSFLWHPCDHNWHPDSDQNCFLAAAFRWNSFDAVAASDWKQFDCRVCFSFRTLRRIAVHFLWKWQVFICYSLLIVTGQRTSVSHRLTVLHLAMWLWSFFLSRKSQGGQNNPFSADVTSLQILDGSRSSCNFSRIYQYIFKIGDWIWSLVTVFDQ